jgi:hypothetical protein
MSTLTVTHGEAAPAASAASSKSFWQRAYEAIIVSRQRRAERDIAAFLGRTGGTLSDETEREIMRRLSGQNRRGF